MNNRANTLGVLGDIRNIVLYLKSKNIDFAVLKELQNGITSLNFLIIFKNDEALLTNISYHGKNSKFCQNTMQKLQLRI